MDWKLGTNSWDFTHFQQEEIPLIDGSNGIDSQRSRGELLIDLKLGQTGGSCDKPPDKLKELSAHKTAPSIPTSIKRDRAAANGGAFSASCLVDGCDSDLSNCREYHRRHKVCEKHSKTPEVTIGGLRKRFCQQCSRFHNLEEFDEEKRSCRKRLDGHNRRRRKPQPEPPLYSGKFSSRYRGMEFSPFSSPQVYSSNAVGSTAWPGLASAKQDARFQDHHKQQLQLLEKHKQFLRSSSMGFGEGSQSAFLQDITFSSCQEPSVPGPSASQATHKTVASLETSSPRRKILYDGWPNHVSESPSAPSLLSFQHRKTSGASLNSILPHSASSLLQPSFPPSMPLNGLDLMDSINIVRGNGAGADCEAVFPIESIEPPDNNKALKTFPFYWD